jgi:protoporphyrin/coproporphyrin ferrochelatase
MTSGVLVMAYGTPRSLDEVESYYTHIRRGSPPPPELLDELRSRYQAIGGVSPLAARTEAQRRRLETALAGSESATGRHGSFEVALGQKHAAPFIEDGVASMVSGGVDRIVGLVLAPHYSRLSVGQYHARASAAAAETGVAYLAIDHWHLLPEYLDFLATAVVDARRALPERHKVLFTAHSLPERALVDDPYPDQLRESAAAVAERTGLLPWPDWALCWQSAGRTADPWRGPDVLDVVRDLAATGRCDGVLVCPQGFVADHLEVLYDLDIEAAAVASEHGLAFARTRSLNDDPEVMGALARLVIDRLEHAR